MSFPKLLAGALALGLSAMPALAGDILIKDAYLRTTGALAKSAAAFLIIENRGDGDDRLIAARSDLAKQVSLHTHIEAGDGIMQMRPVEGGFAVPAHGMHVLKRGADHLMFMGLTRKVADGDTVQVTLTFETAGEITVDIPVDLNREPGEAMDMKMDMNASDG